MIDKPRNHRKRYTESEKQQLYEIAKKCKNKDDIYNEVTEELAEEFGRTKIALCKQLELINGEFWAS